MKIKIFILLPLIVVLSISAGTWYLLVREHKVEFATNTKRNIEVLRINILDIPQHFDPAKATDTISADINQQIHRGLVQIDVDGQLKPALAEKWVISADLKTYTFYLRENIRFHNGREIEAQDFLYSFKRILEPHTKSPRAFFLNQIEGAQTFQKREVREVSGLRALDKKIFQIKLVHPYVPMMKTFAATFMSVVPREAIEDQDVNFEFVPIGAGPFIFESFDKEKKIIALKANPFYFQGESVIKNIEYYILTDEEAYYRFIAKDLDLFKITDRSYADQLVIKGFSPQRRIQNAIGYFGINHKLWPLNDKKVRQAIYLSLDWERYKKDILTLGQEVADQLLPRDIFGRLDTSTFERFNLERAQELIRQASYGNRLKDTKIKLLKYKLHQNIKEDQFFQSCLKKIGLSLEVEYVDGEDFVKRLKKGDFHFIYRQGYPIISDPHYVFSFLQSKNIQNHFRYNNPTVDYLIDLGQRLDHFEKRRKIYEQLSQIIWEDVALIPLYYWDNIYALQSGINLKEMRYVYNEDLYLLATDAK